MILLMIEKKSFLKRINDAWLIKRIINWLRCIRLIKNSSSSAKFLINAKKHSFLLTVRCPGSPQRPDDLTVRVRDFVRVCVRQTLTRTLYSHLYIWMNLWSLVWQPKCCLECQKLMQSIKMIKLSPGCEKYFLKCIPKKIESFNIFLDSHSRQWIIM